MRDPRGPVMVQGSGPGRWVLIAGGILTMVLLAVLFGGALSVPRVLAWGLGATRDRLLAALAADTKPYERQHLRRSFDCVARGALEGKVGERELGALSRACNEALADRRVTAEELQAISTILRGLCSGDATS